MSAPPPEVIDCRMDYYEYYASAVQWNQTALLNAALLDADNFWRATAYAIADCNPGIRFLIPGSGIEKFVIPGSRDPVSELGLQIGRYFGIPNWRILCTRHLRNVYPKRKEWQWLSKYNFRATAQCSTL